MSKKKILHPALFRIFQLHLVLEHQQRANVVRHVVVFKCFISILDIFPNSTSPRPKYEILRYKRNFKMQASLKTLWFCTERYAPLWAKSAFFFMYIHLFCFHGFYFSCIGELLLASGLAGCKLSRFVEFVSNVRSSKSNFVHGSLVSTLYTLLMLKYISIWLIQNFVW